MVKYDHRMATENPDRGPAFPLIEIGKYYVLHEIHDAVRCGPPGSDLDTVRLQRPRVSEMGTVKWTHRV